MTVSRDVLNAGRVDLCDITTGAMLEVEHPGAILREEFLEAMGITAYRLARDIAVPKNRITGIVNGTRAITADTALRCARYFGNSAAFWMNLQSQYDLAVARRDQGREIDAAVRPRSGAVGAA